MIIETKTLAVLGSGNMASAFIRGLISTKTMQPEQILVINPIDEASAIALKNELGIIYAQPQDISSADIILFACKPQNFSEASVLYRPFIHPNQLVISIMAGISTESINVALGELPVIRTMPNLALAINTSCTAFSPGKTALKEHCQITTELFSALGTVHQVEESMMSAVTALSGSGPAYIYLLAEAMTSAAINDGMPAEIAADITMQTLLGSILLLDNEQISPAEMRKRITSYKGTTEAGINTMTERGFFPTVEAGYLAARKRADELGQ